MSYDSMHSSGGRGSPVRAKLKWMNDAKGFGFVVPEGHPSDAFLHITVLRRIGIETLGEGAEILCTIGPGPKGPQVIDVLEVFSHGTVSSSPGYSTAGKSFGAPPRFSSSRPATDGPTEELTGVVKWYKPEKSFGFIIPDGGDKDIFVHKSCLDRAGIDILVPGQKVRATVKTVPRGREVVTIALQE